MPIPNPWKRLTAEAVDALPQKPGVYEFATLVRNSLLIARTAGKDLRACLREEMASREGLIRQQALYFRYEDTAADEQRYRELLDEYRRTHDGKLPPFNQTPQKVDGDRVRLGPKRAVHPATRGQLRVVG